VIRWYLFIRFADMPDAMCLGWMPLQALHGSHHGNWSVLCQFVCCCDRRPPKLRWLRPEGEVV